MNLPLWNESKVTFVVIFYLRLDLDHNFSVTEESVAV